ncbi:response regulator [Aquabacter sp. CN5-332]|uniref:response regulator n=1 Tax=Aquabacter sp. CN5-332 TaxID=3156608 RepID=UPI0032B52DC8
MTKAQAVPELAGRSKAILVVEDEALVRLVICEALREQGFTVVEAASAEEAEAVLASGLAVDLVFTDVHMPGTFDGLELARRLRLRRPDLPVLVTSGRLDQAGANGATGFLRKPYLPADALALIFSLIRKEAME